MSTDFQLLAVFLGCVSLSAKGAPTRGNLNISLSAEKNAPPERTTLEKISLKNTKSGTG